MRKVRGKQVAANSRALKEKSFRDGKCNRKYTAPFRRGKGEIVRPAFAGGINLAASARRVRAHAPFSQEGGVENPT